MDEPKRKPPDPAAFVQEFDSLGGAEVVKALLESHGVPGRLEVFTVAGIPARVRLHVDPPMAHRARWILSEHEVSEGELAYLATGELDPEADEE